MASGNTKNFELKLGKTGLVIVIAGMAALLCCTFLFGVNVGKNIDYYPEKIASFPQKILALVWRPAKVKVAQTAAGNRSVQKQTGAQEELDLTFYNTLTSKKGTVKEQPIPDKKYIVDAPAKQQLSSSAKNDLSTASINPDLKSIKQHQERSIKPEDEIEAKIKEAAAAANPAGEIFSLQVASLKEKAKANQMSKKLSSLGYTARIVENNIPKKGKWFRVVIDGFTSKVKAQAAADKIADNTGTKGIVRRVDAAAYDN